MKQLFALLILLIMLGCSAEEAPKTKVLNSDSLKVDTAAPVKVDTRIYDRNVVEKLTDFGAENPETKVKLSTIYGDIYLRLYENTPLHRANFVQLIKKGIYDKTMFARVVKGFIIQGGSSSEDYAMTRKFYHGDYTIPSEMNKGHIHKYGALAMSRSYNGNPEKRSDAFDFYIVIGEKMYPRTLHSIQEEKGIKYSQEELNIYKTKGGTPHLDLEHTVFGEVYKGMDVVLKINSVEVDNLEWPKKDIFITFEIVE